MQEQLVVAR